MLPRCRKKPSFALPPAGCRSPDYTQGPAGMCEVHHIAMFKRTVPFAHGIIPISRVEVEGCEWKHRMDHYPHPGDCQPATVVLPGETHRVVVYVCKECETAKAAMQAENLNAAMPQGFWI